MAHDTDSLVEGAFAQLREAVFYGGEAMDSEAIKYFLLGISLLAFASGPMHREARHGAMIFLGLGTSGDPPRRSRGPRPLPP